MQKRTHSSKRRTYSRGGATVCAAWLSPPLPRTPEACTSVKTTARIEV
jgi:hypothetical protein